MPHYKDGQIAKVGDRVLIEFKVTSVSEAEHCSCGLSTVNPIQGASPASLTVNIKDICSMDNFGLSIGFSVEESVLLTEMAKKKDMSVNDLLRQAVRFLSAMDHKIGHFPEAWNEFTKATDLTHVPCGCGSGE